ncbi:reactive intermediate/imine deaminase [Candidatus Woesearchaeota archaeon CG_4_10_14_0_8_um_filter_47_5]|nr:MAG: reactive intermediate/imine deaminase [Candidatus Woesearchaeota archaeon CG_4_10_14_0_8_um_filter_47_5]
MAKKIITSSKAPKAVGPYSQAVLHNFPYTLEFSGQLGIDPKTGKLVQGGIAPETEQTLANIQSVLSEVGWGFGHVVKTRIYLKDMAHYQQVNEIYAQRFHQNPPARIALGVRELPLGALVEIECTAAGDSVTGDHR